MAESAKSAGWRLFDQIVSDAPLRAVNPWRRGESGAPEYVPDYDTLRLLLGVPLLLRANSQSGVPALALDVWAAYEMRRAGFDPDRVWPREEVPRVLPAEVTTLMSGLPRALAAEVRERIATGKVRGITLASANLLGKNYVKQVDVVMSSWQTGPELMISTKRMDSSFGKNAANRVEESYGDAKNLRLRHPQSGLGFFYSLRSTALTEEPDKAAWLIDLLAKLGREDDAYDAVGLIIPEWDDHLEIDEYGDDDPDPLVAAGIEPPSEADPGDAPADLPAEDVAGSIARLPEVRLRLDEVPAELDPARFLAVMVGRVLANCPINFHIEARARLRAAGGAFR
ncbi:MAG TPA: hypothetical protein VK816_07230 [Jatrophihabitantaceae bacterium]|nr:hypothetical protein [Jatrophihabitantaceae bacterium]